MQTLSIEQIEDVSGGWLPLVISVIGLAVAVIGYANELEDFKDGFVEGFERGSKGK
jgi:lactobin A/cerein 7B family class IIb bacteriocin